MSSETRGCQNCKSNFTIEPDDFDFYAKIQVPAPTWCPQCRLIRRLAWRNERTLYKRVCGLCGESKILMYPAESPYKVYCYPCWWSDKWDPYQYAKEYDFSKPFFTQFQELLLAVPRPGIIKQKNQVESEYTNRVTDMRNCYLLFGSTDDEYCRYGSWFNFCKECVDCYHVEKCQRCYECIDCFECYNLAFSQECNGCADSWFLANCNNCQNCFGCVNLRSKSYCIFNKQYSKEEYSKIISGLTLGSAESLEKIAAEFSEFKKGFIMPALVSHHNKNVSGNWIENSKNLRKSFSCTDVEEGAYSFSVFKAKEVMDFCFWGGSAELVYDVINTGLQVSNVAFANECWVQVANVQYAMNCHNSHDLFGCIGLRNSEYCILNKKYEKEEYEILVKKIKEQMANIPYIDKKGRIFEYGEFFPPEISPFSYNETIAQELFPTTKAAATETGLAWKDFDAKDYQISLTSEDIPDNLADVSDSITKEIIGCAHAGKCSQQCTVGFRILPEDLQMYRAAKIPLPRLCPNCRHFERLKKRTPLTLWSRTCMCDKNHSQHTGPCPNTFETSYAPDRSEIVYCEQCYQAEVV